MKPIQLKVQTKSHTYPIIIGSNLIPQISKILKKNSLTCQDTKQTQIHKHREK